MATFVKKVIVGTPVKRVTAGSFDVSNLGGVNISGDAGTGYNVGEGAHNDLLVYDSSASEYRNLNTLRELKVDQFTIDSNSITIAAGDPSMLDLLYINAADGVFINGRLEVDRINQKQLSVFDDSSLTTKFYVDQEVDRVKEVTFEMDDGFIDSLQIYDDENLRIAGGNGISTSGIKVGETLTITTSLDSTQAGSGTFGSSIRIPIIRTNHLGQVDSISDIAVASIDSINYDSSSGLFTINTSDGGVFSDSINLNPFTTSDLIEGSAEPQEATESYSFAVSASGNFFYSVTGTDRTGSVSGGDPAIEMRTDDTITFNNSVSGDHPLYIKTVQGDDVTNQVSNPAATGQGTATVSWTPTVAGTYYYQCAVHNNMYGIITVTQRPGVPEANLYYRRSRFDSALGDTTSIATIRKYVSATGDLQYDSGTGIFSVNVTQVYGKDDFDSDLDAAIENSSNIHWYPDSNYFDLGVTGVDSGTYGSAIKIPKFTVDQYGRLDSITEIDVAGVSSVSWDPSTSTHTINTADGGSFPTIINSWGDSQKLSIGDEDNIQIYRDGSLSKIKYNGDLAQIIVNSALQIIDSINSSYIMSYDASTGHIFQDGNQVEKIKIEGTSEDGNVLINTNLLPKLDATYDLGDSNVRWKDLWLSGNTLHLGTVALRDSNGSLSIQNASGQPGSLALRYLDADSAHISQLSVDSLNIGQLELDSAYLNNINVNTADIDTGVFGEITIDSAYITQLNVSQADADSLYADTLNVNTADIDNATLSQVTIDSAYATQLNVITADIDTLTSADAILDSAYISQLNVSQGDIDSLYADQLNVSQADIDSLYADQLNVITADIDNGTFGQLTIDSAHVTSMDGVNIRFDSGRIDTLSADILEVDSVSVGFVKFDQVLWNDNVKPSNIEGAVYYNSGPDALVYKPASASPVKIGQDEVTRVYNNTGVTIAKGTPVYVTGAANDFPTIDKAKADDISTINATIGVVKDSINTGDFGLVLERGLIGRLSTSQFNVGDTLYVSADSEGKFTTTAPVFPNFAYEIGRVLVSDSVGGSAVGGCIQIDQSKDFFEALRVTGNGRIDNNLTIGGNLSVLGTQTQTSVQSLAVADTIIELGKGNTIGASTLFAGTGDQNATLVGHYIGDSNKVYHVRIQTSDANGDTLQWSFEGDYSVLEPFDSSNGPTSFVLSDGDLSANLAYGISISVDNKSGHDVGDSWQGDAAPIDVQIGIIGNYNPVDDSHAYSGLIRDPSDDRWKFFQQYLPEPAGNVNTSEPSFEFADIQVKNIFATQVTAALTGDVTGTVSDISNHTTTNLIEGTQRYFTDARVDSNLDDGRTGGITRTGNIDMTGEIKASVKVVTPTVEHTTAADPITITGGAIVGAGKDFHTPSGKVRTPTLEHPTPGNAVTVTGGLEIGSGKNINAPQGTITTQDVEADSARIEFISGSFANYDSGQIGQLSVDSLYADQLNISQADIDSLHTDQLNVEIADIDTLTSADAIIDSAYIGQLNVTTGDIDTLTSADAIIDSAYIGQLNVSQGDIDSLHASQLDVDSAYITQLHVSQAHIDSLFADTINLATVDIDTLSADSAVITSISGDSAVFIDIVRSNSPAIAGTYGSASLVPVLTIDGSGFVDSVGTVSVAGVTGFAWDSSTSTATISTADGGSYPAIINGFGTDERLYFGDSNYIHANSSGNLLIDGSDDILLRPASDIWLSPQTGVIYVGGDLIPLNDSQRDLGSASNKWKDLYLSGSTINLGNVKLQDSDGGLKVMHSNGAMTQVKAGHLKADSAAVDLLRVLDDSNGDYRIENNIVQRTYENRDSLNLTSGITQDSDGKGLINIYVRTGFKTGQHRYWNQGSAKGYFIAYDSDHLWTDKEIQAPLLDLLPGVTYRLHHNDSSMATHDIRFYWDNQKSGLLSDSAADIKYIGTAGSIDVGNSYAQIKVKDDGPRSFGYQCINHPYMGNLAITNSGAGGRILGTAEGIKVDGTIEGIMDGGTF